MIKKDNNFNIYKIFNFQTHPTEKNGMLFTMTSFCFFSFQSFLTVRKYTIFKIWFVLYQISSILIITTIFKTKKYNKLLLSEEEEEKYGDKSEETEEITISVPSLSNKTIITQTLEDDPSVTDDIQNRKDLKFDPVIFAPTGDVYSFFHVRLFFSFLNV